MRLTEAGGQHDQARGVAREARLLERAEGFLLDRIRRGRDSDLDGDVDGRAYERHGSTGAVGLDPRAVERSRGGMGKEPIKGGDQLCEGRPFLRRDHAVVPLDARRERALRQVRAAHERHALAAGAAEGVRLRMEGHDGRGAWALGRGRDPGLEDAQLAVAFEVEEAREGVGIGDAEVIAGEQAQAAFPREEVAEMLLQAGNAAGLDEADGDVSLVGGGELIDEVGKEGIVLAPGDEARGGVRVLGARVAGDEGVPTLMPMV